MKKLVSINYSEWAFNLSMLLLRVGAGALIIPHGYDKLVHYTEYRHKFINFLGMGQSFSLMLAIFAEFFCAMFLVIGLFSRAVVIPLIITMAVVVFKVNHGNLFGNAETATLFLLSFLVILLCGPGKASIDAMIK